MTDRHISTLGPLANPYQMTGPLDLGGAPKELLMQQLRTMLTIRLAEEAIASLREDAEIGGPCHLGIGQEAIAAGVSSHLNVDDRVFGAHRSHSHYLALGGDLEKLFAETLGKDTGCSRGMGGSMHLYGADVGFHGSVPIVAATIPIAAGAALAIQMDGSAQVAVSYFGDGAAEEGVLHETLNFASVRGLPILFVCENNLYSSHLDITLRQPTDRVSRFAEAHRIEARVVDGNDAVAVTAAAGVLIARARKGEGPGFLEAVTYRWRGHVDWREDIDVGVRRSAADLAAWKVRDPVKRLVDALLARGDLEASEFEELERGIRGAIDTAMLAARKAPYPAPDALLKRVYVSNAGRRA
jgi:TPP-dependent pyruvate/acetoin dehydrogenase alpha subunit